LYRLQALQNLILKQQGTLSETIPSQRSKIASLEVIDLNFNRLQGPIPEASKLTGTISASSISNLSNKNFFQIENKKFTGTVPDSTTRSSY